jgi:chromosome segregation ATPase
MSQNFYETHSKGGSVICDKHSHIQDSSYTIKDRTKQIHDIIDNLICDYHSKFCEDNLDEYSPERLFYDSLVEMADEVETKLTDIVDESDEIQATSSAAAGDGQNMEDAIRSRNVTIDGFELVLPELELRIRELESEVETLNDKLAS